MSARISLSRKDAQALLDGLRDASRGRAFTISYESRAAIDRVRSALSPRPKKPARVEREKVKRTKKATKREETAAIYEAVANRAGLFCECGCGTIFQPAGPDAPQLDHYWGRGKAPQTVQNCWMLTARHHAQKTNGDPSRVRWHEKFLAHCEWWKYRDEALKAARALESEMLSRASAEAGKGAKP